MAAPMLGGGALSRLWLGSAGVLVILCVLTLTGLVAGALPASRQPLLASHAVRAIASASGYDLRVSAFAAFVKVELLNADQRVTGESYAVAQPNGILHWDSIQTRRGSAYYERKDAAKRGAPLPPDAASAAASGIFGPSVLLAAAVLAWVREDAPFRCHTAEILAIKDGDRQHKALVRFYKLVGLVAVREVGEGLGLQSVLDQLLYGGYGVIMRVPTDELSQNLSKLLGVAEE